MVIFEICMVRRYENSNMRSVHLFSKRHICIAEPKTTTQKKFTVSCSIHHKPTLPQHGKSNFNNFFCYRCRSVQQYNNKLFEANGLVALLRILTPLHAFFKINRTQKPSQFQGQNILKYDNIFSTQWLCSSHRMVHWCLLSKSILNNKFVQPQLILYKIKIHKLYN